MKTCLFALFVLLAPYVYAQQSVPEIPFDSVPDFLKLPPGMNFGEVPGVAVNSKGHVFVFTRSNSARGPAYGAAAAQLLEFGPKGEFLREIGKGLYAWSEAHSVRIDKDDNIWAIDKGSDMIIKFNQAGHVVISCVNLLDGTTLDPLVRDQEVGGSNPLAPTILFFLRSFSHAFWSSDILMEPREVQIPDPSKPKGRAPRKSKP